MTREEFYGIDKKDSENKKKNTLTVKDILRLFLNFIILLFSFFLLILTGTFVFREYERPSSSDVENPALSSHNKPQVKPTPNEWTNPFSKRNINILILGMDKNWTEDNLMYTKDTRTDTIMVASLDLDKKTVGLLSIPRDSYVYVSGLYEGKINGTHAVGGMDLVKEAVEEVLQVDIDYYVIVKVNALPDLIDGIGGVEVAVEKDMDYDDNWGHLHIHLKEGWQTLDGDRAEQYSRFRKDEEGDLGRIRRQQQVLYAIKNKVGNIRTFSQVKGIIDATYKNVETDLSPYKILYLASIYKDVGRDDVKMATVPTYSDSRGDISYQIIDYYLLSDYINEYLLGIPPAVTVEIIDGNGEDTFLYDLEDSLSELGFQVVDVRDEGYIYENSQIIVHSNKVKDLSLVPVVRILGNPLVRNDNFYEESVDLTIIVGTDCSVEYKQHSCN